MKILPGGSTLGRLKGGIDTLEASSPLQLLSTVHTEMAPKEKKEKPARKRKRKQMVLTPRDYDLSQLSDATTVPVDTSIHERMIEVEENAPTIQIENNSDNDITLGEETLLDLEEAGLVVSDADSNTDLEEEYERRTENDPLRDDMDIVTDRWAPEEVDALMTAININRDAIKFHFDGPGGGREVKRQGWRDVAGYVNDIADTHRTVKQCRTKVSDYTQRCKAKYNKLRYAIETTGKGKIKKGLKIKQVEGKALDYLRQEAVKGIPGIEPILIPGLKTKKSSRKNRSMQWEPDRPTKPEYDSLPMKREGVPKNYGAKNRRRVDRELKLARKKGNEKLMLKERKKEKIEQREERKWKKLERINERRARKEEKIKSRARKLRKERKRKEKEAEGGELKESEEKRKKKKKRKENQKEKKSRKERGVKKVQGHPMTIPGIEPMGLE